MSVYTISSEGTSPQEGITSLSCTRRSHTGSVVVSPMGIETTVNHQRSRRFSDATSAESSSEGEAMPFSHYASLPKKGSQLPANSASRRRGESASETIRRVSVDYSAKLQDQRERSSALERYKMLVRSNRLVASAQPSEESMRSAGAGESPSRERGLAQGPSSCLRGASTMNDLVVSDESESEGASPCPASRARGDGGNSAVRNLSHGTQPRLTRSTPSPLSVSLSMERSTDRWGDSTAAALTSAGQSPLPAVPQLDFSQMKASRTPVGSRSLHQDGGEVGRDEAVPYIDPNLTHPYRTSSQLPPGSARPGYEPVTDRELGLQQRNSSAPFPAAKRSTSASTAQPRSQTHGDAAKAKREAALLAKSSTPQEVNLEKMPAAKVSAPDLPEVDDEATATPRVVAAQLFQDDEEGGGTSEEAAHGGPKAAITNHAVSHPGDAAIRLSGSQSVFWVRPASALYAMTESIAAKRKDSCEEEEAHSSAVPHPRGRRRSSTSQLDASRPSVGSYGTPRRRPSTTVPEAKSRFITQITAADRTRMESCPSMTTTTATLSPHPNSYELIFSARQTNAQMNTTRRSSGILAEPPALIRAHATSPRPRSSNRECGTARPLSRRASTLSGLSNSSAPHPASPLECNAADVKSVTNRQQESFTKHCARLASKQSRQEKATSASAEPVQPHRKTITTSARSKQRQGGAEIRESDSSATAVTLTDLAGEREDEPQPRTAIPRCIGRDGESPRAFSTKQKSPDSTVWRRKEVGEGSPSKSHRGELDVTASPSRLTPLNHRKPDFTISAVCTDREAGERAAAQKAHGTLEGNGAVSQAPTSVARLSRLMESAASSNELVTAMLQGIVQQRRRVIPCYLCADPQHTSTYRVHVDLCRPKAEAMLRDYYTTVAGCEDVPEGLQNLIVRMSSTTVPSITASEDDLAGFTKECYRCLKALLVPCRRCGVHIRVQDAKEHEMLCGRSSYQNSRAAERVRSTAERILEGGALTPADTPAQTASVAGG